MKPILFILPLYQVTPAINLWGQRGQFKKINASSGAFIIVENIGISQSCTFFTSPNLFFAETGKRGCGSSLHFVCFSTVQYNRKKNLLRLKPRFRGMFVLRNSISKTACCIFSCPPSNHGGDRLGNFPQEHFSVILQKPKRYLYCYNVP